MASEKKLYTYDEVQKEVEGGRWLLIYERKVYDVTKWASRHPGGELVIQHMLGRDATDQILTNHSSEVLDRYLKYFHVGNVNMTDPTTATKVDRPLSMAFRRFHKRVSDEGLFHTRVRYYAFYFPAILALFAVAFSILWHFGHTFWGCFFSGLFMALFWMQSTGIMHDTGHNSITHKIWLDKLIGIIYTNFFTGVSIGWWTSSHHLHHLVPNDPEHDPHIQMLPFVAIATRFFESLYSTWHKRIMPFTPFAKQMVSLQHFVYIPLMALARFVMYSDSIAYLLRREGRWKSEVVAMIMYWIYFVAMIFTMIPTNGLRFFYFLWPNLLLVTLMLDLYVSHNHMSTDPMGSDEDFVAYQLRTTIDFYSPEIIDFFHGGLQFQTAHHFFPRLPRHNLRKVTGYVKEFCRENGLQYTMMGLVEGNIKLLKHLKVIAAEAEKYTIKST